MSGLTCAELAEIADELALDVLPGDVRALALEHLDDCVACRAVVEALSETADALLFARGPMEPPPGFADRVLARLATEQPAPRRRPWRLAVLAAAAAVVIVAGLLVVGFPGRHSADDRMRTVRLISTNGQVVGDVSAYADRESWFFMRVNHGVAAGTYHCVLDVAGGPTIPIGSLTVTDGKGAWGESLTIDVAHVHDARLVAPDGSTVATAAFS